MRPISDLLQHRITSRNCRALSELIMSGAILNDLPEDVASFLTEIKAYTAIQGREKALNKIRRAMNRNKALRVRILKRSPQLIKEKIPSPERKIFHVSNTKICVGTYSYPNFAFHPRYHISTRVATTGTSLSSFNAMLFPRN